MDIRAIGSAPFLRAACSLSLLALCSALAPPALAQSVSPSPALFEAPALGEPVSITFTAPNDNLGVTLCVPDCGETGIRVFGQGPVSEGRSTWTLSPPDCSGEFECRFVVAYTTLETRSRSAVLRVETGLPAANPFDPSSPASFVSEDVSLTGRLSASGNPGVPTFRESGYTIDEGGTVDVVVDRVGGSSGPLSIGWRVSTASTAGETDYRITSEQDGVLSWENGQTEPRRITVVAETDFRVELAETLDILLDDSSEFPSRARVTIADVARQAGTVQFAQAAYAVAEDGGPVTLTLTRTGGADGAATVGYRLIDGTATFGADYGEPDGGLSGSVRWDDGDDAPKRVSIPIAEDDVIDPDETFTVELSLAQVVDTSLGRSPRVSLGAPVEATVTITEATRRAGELSFDPTSYAVDETAGTVTLTVARTGGSDGAATVRWAAEDGSAVRGEDYAVGADAATSGVLRWAPGDAADQRITLDIAADDLDEPDESFAVRLSEPSGAALGAGTVAGVRIADVPPTALDRVRFAVEASEIVEGGDPARLVVRRIGQGVGAVSVGYAIGAGSASLEEDLPRDAPTRGTVSWAAGDTDERVVEIAVLDDARAEGAETFVVTLERPVGAVVGSPDSHEVTIRDDDPPPVAATGAPAFVARALSANEDDGAVTIEIARVDGTAGALSVRYATADVDAVAGEDYTAASGTETWTDGQSDTRTVRIAVADDDAVEPDERFEVRLLDASAAGEPLPLRDATLVVTLVDDDEPVPLDPGGVAFTATALTTSEDGGEVTVEIARVGGSDGTLSVDYATADVDALAGEDYTATSGTETWSDGQTDTRTVVIPIAADARREPDERFEVRLLGARADDEPLPLEATPLVVTIADATPSAPGRVAFAADALSVSENGGAVTVEIARVGGSDGTLSVRYATVDATAVAGEDYTAASGTELWGDGEVDARTVTITLLTDTVVEGDERFLVRLSEASVAGVPVSLEDTDLVVTVADATPDRDDEPTLAGAGSLALVVTAGGDQSGLPGDELEPLRADVVDRASGDARRADVGVRWRVVPAGSAELLDGTTTVSDAAGEVRNRVRVLSRGFVSVIASVDAAVPGNADVPVPPDAPPSEAVFLVRAGFGAAAALTASQSAVGGALDTACTTLDERSEDGVGLDDGERDLLDTCGELDARLRDGELATALDRLAPEELFAIGDAVIDTIDIQVTNVYARINAIRRGPRRALDLAGLNLELYGERIPGLVVDAAARAGGGGGGASADGDGPGSRLGVFVNGTISYGEIDSDGNQRDADVRSSGVTVGADYRFGANTVVGAGLGLVVNETTFVGDDGRADVDGLNLTVFATWYEADAGYLDGVLDVGRVDYDVRRRINLPGRPDRFGAGGTEADVLSLTFSAGKDIVLGGWELGPYTRLSHTQARVGGYAERAEGDGVGSGSVLDIRAHDVRSTRLALGGQLSRPVGTRRGVIVPQLRVESELEAESGKGGIEASFRHDPSGTPFTVEGDDHDSGYVNVGVGASGVFADGRSGYLFYETRLAHETITQHWLKAGIRLEF